MDRNKHNQDPNNLSQRYNRRAKAAALISGLMPLGAFSVYETSYAQSAAASTEAAPVAESAQAMIATQDKQLKDLWNRIKTAKGSVVINGESFGQPANINVYLVSTPMENNPHLYNILEVAMRDKNIFLSSISIGANSGKFNGTTNKPNGLVIDHAPNAQAIFEPGNIELIDASKRKSGQPTITYSVSTGNLGNGQPSHFGKTVSPKEPFTFIPTSSATVEAQFKAYFDFADTILAKANNPT